MLHFLSEVSLQGLFRRGVPLSHGTDIVLLSRNIKAPTVISAVLLGESTRVNYWSLVYCQSFERKTKKIKIPVKTPRETPSSLNAVRPVRAAFHLGPQNAALVIHWELVWDVVPVGSGAMIHTALEAAARP